MMREVALKKLTRNKVNIAAFADLFKNDRRISSRMIAESLNTPKTVVLRILKEDLGKRKLCARFVPHSLTLDQREDRVTSCQDIIAMADADKFLTCICLMAGVRLVKRDVRPSHEVTSDRHTM